jgi:hypothetical protein
MLAKNRANRDYVKNKKKMEGIRYRQEKLTNIPLGSKIIKDKPFKFIILEEGTKLYSLDGEIFGVVASDKKYILKEGVLLFVSSGRLAPKEVSRVEKCFDGYIVIEGGIVDVIISEWAKGKIKEVGEIYKNISSQESEKIQKNFLDKIASGCYRFRFSGVKGIDFEPCGGEKIETSDKKNFQDVIDKLIQESNKQITRETGEF